MQKTFPYRDMNDATRTQDRRTWRHREEYTTFPIHLNKVVTFLLRAIGPRFFPAQTL